MFSLSLYERYFQKFQQLLSVRILNACIFFVFAMLACVFIFLSPLGLDITDESYYLLKTIYPAQDVSRITFFGEFYSPILSTFRSLALFRFFGLLQLLLPLLLLSHAISVEINKNLKMIFGILGSAATLYYWQYLLLTPSYNLLVLSSTVFVSWAALRAKQSQNYFTSYASALAAGLGLGLVFLAKPTSAAVLVPGYVLFITWRSRFGLALRIISISGVMSIVTLLLFFYGWFGHLGVFFESVLRSLEFTKMLGGGYDLKSLIISPFTDFLILLLPKNIILENSIFILYFFRNKNFLSRFDIGFDFFFFANLIFQVCCLYLSFGVISVVEVSFYNLIVLTWRYFSKYSKQEVDKVVSILLFMCWCFLSTRFGTNNRFLFDSMGSLVFIWGCYVFLASLVFSSERKTLSFFILMSFLILGSALKKSFMPYRSNAPIWEHDQGFTANQLDFKLDRPTFEYANSLKQKFANAGFLKGDFLIDLTGASPGALLLVEARFLGFTWNLGGYSGSNDYFVSGLSVVPCRDIALAWLLVSESSELALDSKNLKFFDLDINEDYVQVGEIFYEGYRNDLQKIYRPKNKLKELKNCVLD